VKISRAAMKAAQEAAKAAKAPAKERKIIFFQIFKKASVSQLALFFMLIIFCNAKNEANLLSHFSIRAPISQYKRTLLLLSVVSFFIYPVRVHKDDLHQGYPK
jgi:hypothetical protein